MSNEDEELVGVCAECGTDQSDSYMERNVFYQSGAAATCQFCGGVVFITKKGARAQNLQRITRDRGL